MPLLKAEADKLSNQLVAGIIEEIIEKDELFALLPFVGVNGKAYVYDRENALPTADFLNPNDTVNEDAGTFTQITATLKILAGDVDVDKFIQETESDTNSQKAVQIALKAKAVARKFKQTVAAGDITVDTKSFDGLSRTVSGGQTINAGANGAALTLAMLDQLCDQVTNGPDALIMRPGTIRAYRALLYASGGIQPAMVEIPNFGTPVLAHNGVPILRNDYLSAVEVVGASGANLCSIYAVRLNEGDGLHGLYGGASAGIRVEDIGTVQNKDASAPASSGIAAWRSRARSPSRGSRASPTPKT
jgi:hypothetical protein